MDDLRAFLEREKVDAELIDLGVPMTTAQAAADQLHIPVGSIFKSLVMCNTEGKAFVVVLPGDARVDQKAVARAVSTKKVKFAPEDVVLRETGYPAGGTPPLGHRKPLPVLVDEKLLGYEFGYGGGGRHELLLKIRPDELVRVSKATVAPISL
jgi:Cys-tRNA(Pro)/Cys-tRNA(Cys) deacylase